MQGLRNAWTAAAPAGRGKQAAGRKEEEKRAAGREAGKRASEEAAEQKGRRARQAAHSSRGTGDENCKPIETQRRY